MNLVFPVLMIAMALSSLSAAPALTRSPVLSVNPAGGYWVDFTMSEAADVEVSIVNAQETVTLRHLAAGVLGAAAPAPFAKDSLHQKIAWDGKDDNYNAVADGASCKVRVRAGMALALQDFIGENNYAFYRRIQGLAMDSTGAFYAFGAFPRLAHHGTSGMILRRYGRTGDYEKTLWPPPAGLRAADLAPYRVITLPDSTYLPVTEAMDAPQFGNSLLTYENTILCPQLVNGALLLVAPATLKTLSVRPDGIPVTAGTLVKSPALPAATSRQMFAGPVYLTLSPDRSFFLLSGCFRMDSTLTQGWFPSDTGFWREGQVFKVDVATGAVTSLLSLPVDSLPKTVADRRNDVGPRNVADLGYMAAIHGTAIDDSGRIYVCDRVRDEVGIYSMAGAKLGALAVTDPDQVAVNPKTGAVYVLSRQFGYAFNNSYNAQLGSGVAKFTKFAGISAVTGKNIPLLKAAAVASPASITAVMDEQKTAALSYGRLNMAVDYSGEKAVVWLNGAGGTNFCADTNLTNLRALRDDGDTLVTVQNFRARTRGVCTGFDRIVVDRRTEKLYVNNSWDELYKVEDWANPVFVRCSTSAGAALSACDMGVSPDGFLYVREWGYPGGPLKRYTQDHLHARADFMGRGTNVVAAALNHGYGGGTQDQGIGFSRQGQIYVYSGSYANAVLKKYDTTGAVVKDSVVKLGLPAGGIRTDYEGNIYLCAAVRTAAQTVPPGFTAYWGTTRNATGSVVKFNPDSGGGFGNVTSSDLLSRTVQKALKIYNQNVSPFGGTCYSTAVVPSARWACVCRTPRFDVDAFGRVYAPHTVTGRVSIADNAGNLIAAFGEYGNVDSRGPGVPLAWPVGVAASDDFVYVTDLVNARLVRLRRNYALDNIPVRADRTGSVQTVTTLESVPEPFNPQSRVTVRLAKGGFMKLDVLDFRGRMVRALFEGRQEAGLHRFQWDARDDRGAALASGFYFYRLQAGRTLLTKKTLYLR